MDRLPKPQVSVIIPVYNRERLVNRCIDSVLAQQYTSYEIILVDNNSSDGSKDILKEYEKFYPHKIRCCSEMKKGAAASRNCGAKAARGDYLAFLDSDDLWFSEKLKVQMFFLDKKQDIDLIYTSYARFGDDGKLQGDELEKLYEHMPESNVLPVLICGCFIWTSTVVMKKNVFMELGGFNESLQVGEDYDLWLRAAVKNRIFGIPLVLAQYRQHDNNLMKLDLAVNKTPSEISVVENFVKEHSEIRKILPLRLLKKRFSVPFFDRAYLAFQQGNMLLARRFILKALAQYPFSMTYYRYLMLTLVPLALITQIKNIRRSV